MAPLKSILSTYPIRIGIVLNTLIVAGYISNYTLAGFAADMVVVGGALLMALYNLIFVIACRTKLKHKWALPFTQLPAYFLLAVLLIPYVSLGSFFFAAEVASSRDIVTLKSPKGDYTLGVRYTAVGAYGRGRGRYAILKSRPWLPVVEKCVFSESCTHKGDDDVDFFKWVTPDTIMISETGVRVSVD